MIGIGILGAIMAAISAFVSSKLKKKFQYYSEIHMQNGLSGKQIAEKMLADHDVTDVEVISVRGQLTDHYNPTNKTVNLSEVVYGEVNASAAAVAAHEVGHAIQHAYGYKWLQMRSKLVPVVNLSSKVVQWVLLAGIAMVQIFPQLLLIGIALFAMTTLFSIVTLPVEYDASNRALKWMETEGIATEEEYDGAKDALKWAARTYLVAAIGSIATLLYYLSIFLRKRR